MKKKLGRVKIEFQWQKAKNKTTNRIRVQTPDAGKSDKVPKNRGFVFIPEKDDIVMIDFEYGDPNRPYVAGSIFSEKVSKGGGDNNKLKTITTRSGSTITFDDEKGSITIKDKHGSDSVIKLDGNKNITIDADTSLTINIGKGASVLKMDNKGNITMDGAVIRINASKNISADAKIEMTLHGDKTVSMTSDKIDVSASEETTLQGGGGQIVEKGGMVDIN